MHVAMHGFYFALPQNKRVFPKYQVATIKASEEKLVSFDLYKKWTVVGHFTTAK